MIEPVYISDVRIERRYGPVRIAYLPAEEQPITFGAHGSIAAHCGGDLPPTPPLPSHACSLDYVVAATGASLVGIFGKMLEEHKINASHGRLTADARGEISKAEDDVLIIRKIHVEHQIVASEKERETIEQVHAVYAKRCPLFRNLSASIDITSSYVIIPE